MTGDTVHRGHVQRRRGRHAAADRPGLNPVTALTVGAVCRIAGRPLPQVQPEGAPGRHHEDATRTSYALAA